MVWDTCTPATPPVVRALIGVPNVTALRALPGVTGDVVELLDYNGSTAGSQGIFQWGPAAPDDGVTRFNAGAANVAGWRRVYEGPLLLQWGGAVGDNVTDDTAAIQRVLTAANALGGKEIVFPKGRYKVTAQLDMTNMSNVHLRGEGNAILQVNVANIALGGGNISDCSVQGLRFQGTASRMIAMSTVTRVRIRDNDISGAIVNDGVTNEPAGIWIAGGTDCWIESNSLHDNGDIGGGLLAVDIQVDFAGGVGLHINGNVCRSSQVVVGIEVANSIDSEVCENYVNGPSGSGSNNNGYGILVSKTTTCLRVVVANNVILNTDGSGIYFRGAVDCIASGNSVFDCCQNQDDTTLNVAGIAAATGNNTFTGNIVSTSGKSGISWTGTCLCTGNLIDSTTTEGIWARGVASGSLIQGNRIRDAGVRGILFETASADDLVADNIILSPGNNGIEFTLGLSGGSITGNVLEGVGGKGVVIIGGTQNLIADNLVNGANDNCYNITSTETVISNNVGTGGTNIGMVASGDYATLIGNNLIGNTVDGYTLGGLQPILYGNRFTTTTTDKPAYSMQQQVTDTNTASAAFVDFGTLASTLTVNRDSKITIRFSASIKGNPAVYTFWRIIVDGVLIVGSDRAQVDATGNAGAIVAIECQTPALTAGAHTVKVQWHSDGATAMVCNPATTPGYYGANLECQEIRAA